MMTAHPLYPAVKSERDADGTIRWRLGDRQVLWSKELPFKEQALAHFLREMSAHETITLTRRLPC